MCCLRAEGVLNDGSTKSNESTNRVRGGICVEGAVGANLCRARHGKAGQNRLLPSLGWVSQYQSHTDCTWRKTRFHNNYSSTAHGWKGGLRGMDFLFLDSTDRLLFDSCGEGGSDPALYGCDRASGRWLEPCRCLRPLWRANDTADAAQALCR